ncbi:phage integrase family protein [Caballeronia sordidicola]|uniref:Uncharacterized protein n=1 Tax=Caballeronia sordidicola TaxID=196367 RepID=A0A242MWH3_CABSO|nr:phage integrase family protein [Caballeronia sordidicola]OTP75662.1 hypothetical protein PAMC26577_12965 [Caballeronia sordidicola]
MTKRLTAERITTLGELVAYCNSHGGSWWRSVPRIGAPSERPGCLAASSRASAWDAS